jgi:predicted transcriptional regulator of viral defense system
MEGRGEKPVRGRGYPPRLRVGEPWRETGQGARLSAKAARDELLAGLALVQNGVFTTLQLAGVGLSTSAVHSRVRRSRLHRVHAGVYALVPPSLLSREGRFMAAVLACGPGAVLSHRSAAALHGLRRTERVGIDVTIPGDAHRGHPGIDVHRSRTLTAADVTIVGGIPCTTIARTVLDIAEVILPRQLERVFEQAEQEEVLDFRALEEQIERNSTRVGAGRIRAMMNKYQASIGVTFSELERNFKAMIRPAGIPMPVVNHFIVLPDGEPAIRADFYWPEHRAVVETDGWRTHRTWWAFQRDRRNDQRLIFAGYPVTRLTYEQIHTEPDRLVALIRKMLGGGA